MVKRDELISWCNMQLAVAQFRDYAPNGLQVEGCGEVRKIVCAVTASQAAIDFAAAQTADMLLVHHGLFWKSEPVGIVGWKKRRIQALLTHNISLAGYHLPLDAHPAWGNNAQLARHLGWQIDAQTGEQNLLMTGHLPHTRTAAQLVRDMGEKLCRVPLLLCRDEQQPVTRLAWCTGGGQGFFQAAIDMGVDAFVTGEVSEAQYHLALENEVAFVAAGHHATERYGVQALAQALADEFAVPVSFYDDANPV